MNSDVISVCGGRRRTMCLCWLESTFVANAAPFVCTLFVGWLHLPFLVACLPSLGLYMHCSISATYTLLVIILCLCRNIFYIHMYILHTYVYFTYICIFYLYIHTYMHTCIHAYIIHTYVRNIPQLLDPRLWIAELSCSKAHAGFSQAWNVFWDQDRMG